MYIMLCSLLAFSTECNIGQSYETCLYTTVTLLFLKAKRPTEESCTACLHLAMQKMEWPAIPKPEFRMVPLLVTFYRTLLSDWRVYTSQC